MTHRDYLNEKEWWDEFDSRYEKVKTSRSQPGYVPEFPPSTLIDDSIGGCVKATMPPKRSSKD